MTAHIIYRYIIKGNLHTYIYGASPNCWCLRRSFISFTISSSYCFTRVFKPSGKKWVVDVWKYVLENEVCKKIELHSYFYRNKISEISNKNFNFYAPQNYLHSENDWQHILHNNLHATFLHKFRIKKPS